MTSCPWTPVEYIKPFQLLYKSCKKKGPTSFAIENHCDNIQFCDFFIFFASGQKLDFPFFYSPKKNNSLTVNFSKGFLLPPGYYYDFYADDSWSFIALILERK